MRHAEREDCELSRSVGDIGSPDRAPTASASCGDDSQPLTPRARGLLELGRQEARERHLRRAAESSEPRATVPDGAGRERWGGPRRGGAPPRTGDSAFTLIELLLVVAILAALAAIVAPSLAGSLGRRRVDDAARTIVAYASAARARATAEGRAYVLIVDAGANRQIKLARARDPLLAPDPSSTDAELESDDWVESAPWAKPVELPDGVNVVSADVAGGGANASAGSMSNTTTAMGTSSSGSLASATTTQAVQPGQDGSLVVRIAFPPDGTADEATIELEGLDQERRTVHVVGTSGRAMVQDPERPQ